MAKSHMLKEVANGVIDEQNRFYPFKRWGGVVANFNTQFPAKDGIRYYVKQIGLSYSALVTDAGTIVSVSGLIDRVSRVLCATIHTTLFVWERADTIEVNQLLDKGTALTAAATNMVSHWFTIQYAEVDELEGEYAA